jgi:hypothetical protein
MEKEIKEFLEAEEKDYNTSLYLASKYIPNRNIINQHIRNGNSKDGLERLAFYLAESVGEAYEMKSFDQPPAIAQIPKKDPVVKQAVEEGQEETETEKEVREISILEKNYPELKELLAEKRKVIHDREKLSQDSVDEENEEKSRELASQAHGLDQRRQELDTQINFFLTKGSLPKLPEKTAPIEIDPALKVERQKLSEKRSKLRKKLEKQPGNIDLLTEEAKTNAEIENLDIRIAAAKAGANALK